MPASSAPRRPIVTLTTDFGLADAYVAQMKGAILQACPEAQLVDVTHLVPRHDVRAGSFALERAVAGFPVGTIHVAVVDPGVGTDRALLAVRLAGRTVLCPDNGLITWPWRRCTEPRQAWAIRWRPDGYSATFHGRDILAPMAARLAMGEPLGAFVGSVVEPILLPLSPAISAARRGEVIHVDAYGNATTNVPAELVRDAVSITVAQVGKAPVVLPMRRTYGEAGVGQPLALIGSSDLLEIAVRDGSAADVLGAAVGDTVTWQ